MDVLFFIDPAHGVWISGNLYCKTPDGLRYGLTELRAFGYLVDNQRLPRYSARDIAHRERSAQPLWDVRLPGVRLAQCLSCEGIIARRTAATTRNRCEFCDTPTVTLEGSRRVKGYRPIAFWRGKIYDDEPGGPNPLPYLDQLWVFETWRWEAAEGHELAARILDAAQVHGTGQVEPRHLLMMALYVEHFTTLDTTEWRQLITNQSHDTSRDELVRAVRGFCRGQ